MPAELPSDLKSNKNEKWYQSLWVDSIVSVATYIALMYNRHDLTPDILQFITCAVLEELFFVSATIYWLIWKCFLMQDEQTVNKFNKSKQFEDRAKVIIRAGLEMVVSLVAFQLVFEPFYTFWPWVLCLSVFTFAAIRSVFYEFIDIWTLFFIVTYFS